MELVFRGQQIAPHSLPLAHTTKRKRCTGHIYETFIFTFDFCKPKHTHANAQHYLLRPFLCTKKWCALHPPHPIPGAIAH